MTWRWIQLAAAAACLLVGIIFMVLAVFGVNRFHKALNRMHGGYAGNPVCVCRINRDAGIFHGFP